MRSAFDFAPFRRSTVGFDRLFDMLENSSASQAQENYPPFDLIKLGDNEYRIELAVAGFKPDEIDITAQQNVLIVSGKKNEESESRGQDYVYRGISTRSFERRFALARLKLGVEHAGSHAGAVGKVAGELLEPGQIAGLRRPGTDRTPRRGLLGPERCRQSQRQPATLCRLCPLLGQAQPTAKISRRSEPGKTIYTIRSAASQLTETVMMANRANGWRFRN